MHRLPMRHSQLVFVCFGINPDTSHMNHLLVLL